MGEYPSGRVIFTADHRVSFVLTGDNRTSGKTDAEKAALLNSLIAYRTVLDGELYSDCRSRIGPKDSLACKTCDFRCVVTSEGFHRPDSEVRLVHRIVITSLWTQIVTMQGTCF